VTTGSGYSRDLGWGCWEPRGRNGPVVTELRETCRVCLSINLTWKRIAPSSDPYCRFLGKGEQAGTGKHARALPSPAARALFLPDPLTFLVKRYLLTAGIGCPFPVEPCEFSTGQPRAWKWVGWGLLHSSFRSTQLRLMQTRRCGRSGPGTLAAACHRSLRRLGPIGHNPSSIDLLGPTFP